MNVRTRYLELMGRAEGLGLSRDEVKRAIGLAESTYKRCEQEARGDGSSQSGLKVLNKTLLSKLEGLCEAIRSALDFDRSRRSDSVRSYVQHVAKQFESMVPRDVHVLVSVLPPLECVRTEVSAAVVRAALNDVIFEYRFPSDNVTKISFPALERPVLQRRESSIDAKTVNASFRKWSGRFDKVPPVKVIVRRIQMELLARLSELLKSNGSGVENRWRNHPEDAFNRLQSNVKFFELKWVPVMFNEKLTWSTSDKTLEGQSDSGGPKIRKEIVLQDFGNPNASIYSDDTQWVRVPLALPQEVVRSLVFCDRATELKWPRESLKAGRRKLK